jgi:hypothetical protein
MRAHIIGIDTLSGQLEKAVWSPAKLKPIDELSKEEITVFAYCHGIFLLPQENSLCLVVGRSQPNSNSSWISNDLKAAADVLFSEHELKVAEFEEYIAQKKKDNDSLFGKNSDMASFAPLACSMLANESRYSRPIVTAEQLLPLIPRAAKFAFQTSDGMDNLVPRAISAIAVSGWSPSRGGTYSGILPNSGGRRRQGLVSWVPHQDLPSYPEIRWAVQRRLPKALRTPRSDKIAKGEFDTKTESALETAQIQSLDSALNQVQEALEDLQLDQSDFRSRVDEARRAVKTEGFDAIAWYQPYHVWTEETWGIYFDAHKLDALALSFLDDFRSVRISGSHSYAAMLALGLTYAHEIFHARVEAALSWLEINTQKPRHLRYKEHVYQALRETPNWLEEALANWSSWSWFKSSPVQSMFAGLTSDTKCLDRLIETSLDLAPPGYRDWRLGNRAESWRRLSNQLSTGRPIILGGHIDLPLESILSSSPPYDFKSADIPMYFVGPGVIADRLKSHPSTLNVPPRRELERALKHFGHTLDASGGKGGHQKWTGPDRRAFTLPTRDPVSGVVFKSFLHHMGIDKATYVRQVRPNL